MATEFDSYEALLAQLQPQLDGTTDKQISRAPSQQGLTPRLTSRLTPRQVVALEALSGDESKAGGFRNSGDYHEVDDALSEVDSDLGPEERG